MSKDIVLKLFKIVNIKVAKFISDEDDPEADIDIIDDSFYDDLLRKKTLGFGEAYMDGKFTSNNLELLMTKLSKLNDLSTFEFLKLLNVTDYIYFIYYIFWKIIDYLCIIFFDNQSIIRSRDVGKIHYDLPDILYENMLDKTKIYTCAYFEKNQSTNAYDSLYEAQMNKLNLVMNKLQIKDNDYILEIGSGWGFMSSIIAKKYPQSKILGVTISTEQYNYCCNTYRLPNLQFKLMDYREVKEYNTYDKIFSIGMFEQVGYKNYNAFFKQMYNLLKPKGLMLLHTIVNNKINYGNDPFYQTYIFPGGNVTSISQILRSVENTKYTVEDVHCFGLNYYKTLECWYNNFENSFDKLREYDPNIFNNKFRRMWRMYLIMSKVGFKTKKLNLSQFIFSKNLNEIYDRYDFNNKNISCD